LRESQDAGFPHSNDPEKSGGGAVGRGHPEWWSPAIWILMKRGSEGCEAKGRGLNIK